MVFLIKSWEVMQHLVTLSVGMIPQYRVSFFSIPKSSVWGSLGAPSLGFVVLNPIRQVGEQHIEWVASFSCK